MRVFIRYRLVIDEVSCSTPRKGRNFRFCFFSLREDTMVQKRLNRIFFVPWPSIHFAR